MTTDQITSRHNVGRPLKSPLAVLVPAGCEPAA